MYSGSATKFRDVTDGLSNTIFFSESTLGVGGSLLVWLWVDTSDDPTHSELRYAWLPGAGSDRLDDD